MGSAFIVNMRENMGKKGIILWLGLLLLLACSGCGQQENRKEHEQTMASEASGDNGCRESEISTVATDAPTVPDEKAGCAKGIVQVQTDNQRGTGVLWDKQENNWYFVTAAHVVEGLEQAEIYFAEYDKLYVTNVYCVEGLDLAFLELNADLLAQEVRAAYEACPMAEETIKSGDVISAIGYNASVERLEYTGTVWEPWIYTEDFANYMLLCQCEARAGMSGGAVFTAEETLAGIICGQNEEGMLAVLPATVIEYQLFINY